MATPTALPSLGLGITGYFGSRPVQDIVTSLAKPSIRRLLPTLYPQGKDKITQLVDMLPSVKETSRSFTWYENAWMGRIYSGTAGATIWQDQQCTSAFVVSTTTLAAGALCYAKVPSASFGGFCRPNSRLQMSIQFDISVERNAIVLQVLPYDSTYVLLVLRNEVAMTAGQPYSINQLRMIGPVSNDKSYHPHGTSQAPRERTNYMHITRSGMDLPRRDQIQQLQVDADPKAIMRLAMEAEHREARERDLLYSTPSDTLLDNVRLTTTGGLLYFLRTYAYQNILDFYNDTVGSSAVATTALSLADGHSWTDGAGKEFVDLLLERVFRYQGSGTRNCYCGSGWLAGINKLADAGTIMSVSPGYTAYGQKVMQWISPFGTVNFVLHPLFTEDPTYRFAALFLDPDQLTLKLMTDTDYDPAAREGGYDGMKQGLLTDWGMQIGYPETMALAIGGLNNKNYVA